MGAELRSKRNQGHACPCTVRSWPNNARHRVWPRPGGSCRCTKAGGTLVPQLVTGSCSTLRQGPPRKRQEKTKHSRQGTRQEELAGPRRQDPGKRSLPGRLRPCKAIQEQSITRQKIEPPTRGARREGRTQASQEKPAVARQAPRQGLIAGALSGTGRRPPRQATCRGKIATTRLRSSSPATRRSGASPEGTWQGTARPGTCSGMQPPSWRTVAHLTVRLGAVRATVTGI